MESGDLFAHTDSLDTSTYMALNPQIPLQPLGPNNNNNYNNNNYNNSNNYDDSGSGADYSYENNYENNRMPSREVAPSNRSAYPTLTLALNDTDESHDTDGRNDNHISHMSTQQQQQQQSSRLGMLSSSSGHINTGANNKQQPITTTVDMRHRNLDIMNNNISNGAPRHGNTNTNTNTDANNNNNNINSNAVGIMKRPSSAGTHTGVSGVAAVLAMTAGDIK